MNKLPPLTPLPAFEASARLLSFTRAGAELHISQAAVSQQIRSLEENLGVKLFKRATRKITLTEHGQKFQHTIAVALELLENSASELRDHGNNSNLTIAADITMAHMWLMPRFSLFREKFPDIDVSILATEHESECLKASVDLALLYGNGSWEGFNAHLLIPEEVFPVCSPEYWKNHSPIQFDESLEKHILLNLKSERWDWVDWRQLLSENELILSQHTRYYEFNSLPLLFQATLNGQGIGLGWKSLIDSHIENGDLIRPFNVSLKTNRGYYVLRNANTKLTVEAELLFDWIIKVALPAHQ